MNYKIWFMAGLFALPCSRQLCAQDSAEMKLGIEGLFRLADENSVSLKASATSVEAAEAAWQSARSQRLPELSVSASVSYLGDGRLWDRDFSNGMSVGMPHLGNNFSVEATQVVYAGGAVSTGIALADLARQMAALDADRNRQEMRFLLVGFYLELYRLNNQEQVLLKNLELTEQVIRNMNVRRSQGTALKNDIIRYELQREMLALQLTKVRDAVIIINHQLVSTLHLPADTRLVPDSALLQAEVDILAEADWQAMGRESNVALRHAEVAEQMSRSKVRMERAGSLPQVAIFAADHLDGPITIEVPVLDNNFNYWMVGIGIRYSLSSLYRNNRNVDRARLEARCASERLELAREHLETSVQAGYVGFMTSFAELATQRKNVELADENYGVTVNRYDNELALLTDLLDAGNTKLAADLGMVNARINVIYSFFKMKYLTHTL